MGHITVSKSNGFQTYVPASNTRRPATRRSSPAIRTAAGNTKTWAPASRTGTSSRQGTNSSTYIMVHGEERVVSTKSTCCGFAPCCCWIFWICVAVIAAVLIIFCCHHYNNSQKSEQSTDTDVKRRNQTNLGDGLQVEKASTPLTPRKQKRASTTPARTQSRPVKQRTPERT